MDRAELIRTLQSHPLKWGRADGVLVARESVVAEAREWIGTPFHHQAHIKGVGCDCGGLVRGVSIALGLIPADYQQGLPDCMVGYSLLPTTDNLALFFCDFYWQRIEQSEILPGDVIVSRWGQLPQHASIVGDGQTLIHALGPAHPQKVIETPMRWLTVGSGPNSPKFVRAYRLPGVA